MRPDEQPHIVRGRGASPGVVTGRARVVRTEEDFADVAEQDILVVRHATPLIFPALLRARAAVCETGGLLCHLAVLARELRKPCVTGLGGIVDALETGTLLRVDGTKGSLEVVSPGGRQLTSPESVPPAPEEMIPILQFGLFSTAFECAAPVFDVEVAVRVASLVSLPVAFEVGPAWDFAVAGNQVLVAARPLRETVDKLVTRIEGGSLDASEVRRRYLELCSWQGWGALGGWGTGRRETGAALSVYVALNQITWAACVVREPLTKRYESFLLERLNRLDESQRAQLFLDSLITEDRSYILRSCTDGGGVATVWSSGAPRTHGPGALAGEGRAAARSLNEDARARRLDSLETLRRELSESDHRRAVSYVAALSDLVDLTERKNTDLHRCGSALFGDDARRANVLGLLGFNHAGAFSVASEADCRALIRRVADILGNRPAAAPVT